MTIYGENFGSSASLISLTACSSIAIENPHFIISCDVVAGSGLAYNPTLYLFKFINFNNNY